jgi:diguanylate cyclase (GGDEF)-like protein
MYMRPRARPVAEAPVDALLARSEELARRWAIALICARPLEQIAEIPMKDLAHEAPALCAHVVRALGSDGELERMVGGDGHGEASPASRLGVLAGAPDSWSAVAAAEALRGVLWEALLDELRSSPAGSMSTISDRSSSRLVADLADRLAYVCSTVLAATVARGSVPAVSETDVPSPDRDGDPRVGREGGHDPDRSSATLRPAVLVDERQDAVVSPPLARKDDLPQATTPEIEIRDERGEEGPVAWIGSIGRQLQHYERDGSPFAVLLVELVDGERLLHAEPGGEASRLMRQVEEALARELRPADSLTRERAGRYWLVVPQTDGTGAEKLAEQLAGAVRSSASHRGTPLEVSVGIAACPEDGQEASALAAHADVGLYAARAAGRSV